MTDDEYSTTGCQTENVYFIYSDMDYEHILNIPTDILTNFLFKLGFILREQLRNEILPEIQDSKKTLLDALKSIIR